MLRRLTVFSRVSLKPSTFKNNSVKSGVSNPVRPLTEITSSGSIRQRIQFPQLSETRLKTATKAVHPIQARLSNTADIQRKTVVIIGGRSQLGGTLITRFLASGFNVVCTTQGTANHKLDEVGFHLEGNVNIGDKKAWTKEYWKTFFARIQLEQGHIHTVVNCAGISINDPNAGYTMDDINRKPVAPMLEACIELEIERYTFISTQAAAYPEARKPSSYSLSKFMAEQDMAEIMAANPGTTTKTTILRPDLIISADNPGHFGSPQRMSTFPFIKLTVGHDPKKAGSTLLQPVAAFDVADAVVNISEHNIATPSPIDACGPEAHSIEDLMTFFKSRQNKHFLFGLKIPAAAIIPAARKRPWGALEPDHLELIKHHEKHLIGKVDTIEFESIVAITRSDMMNPLLTLKEIFDFTKRPTFGAHNLGLYTQCLLSQLSVKDALSIFNGLCIGLFQARIDFHPDKKTTDRESNDGVNIAALLAAIVGVSLAARFYRESEASHKKQSDTTHTIEDIASDNHVEINTEDTRRMLSVGM